MRKLLSLSLAVLFAGALAACDEQPTNPDANASVHGAAILNATADIDAVDTEAAELNGFEPGNDVGTVTITDDRAQQVLTVDGSATELTNEEVDLTPAETDEGTGDGDGFSGYVSLFYDVESTVTGPEACEPALGFDSEFNQNKVLSLPQMEIGPGDEGFILDLWNVNETGDKDTLGSIEMTLPEKQYIKVKRIGTVSIRDLRVNNGFGPDAVVGCGSVVVN